MSIIRKVRNIPFLKKILKKIYLWEKAKCFQKLSASEKTDEKLVVFDAFQGRNYACSPKAIYEYMIQSPKFREYDYVWVFRDPAAHGDFPENTKLVAFDSRESFRAYARAGTWITNSRLRDFIVPRKDQKYIQCWHGTPFKKIGCDIDVAGNATSTVEEIYKEYTGEAKKISKFLSPSPFCTEKLISAFNLKKLGKEDCIIEKGYPRNDALFTFHKEKLRKLKEELGIPSYKKVILYCPTFRDNQFAGEGYTLKLALDFDHLRNQLGDGFVVLFRAHYFVANHFDFEKYEKYVYNVSSYDDINDLYLISDILITDYSSVFFDYANLHRPILFYQYDVEDYEKNMRDFYFDQGMLPGPIVHTQKELEEQLSSVLEELDQGGSGLSGYEEIRERFRETFNPLDGKDCAKKVVHEIFGR